VFTSFFPKPKVFFLTACLWLLAAILLWYGGARGWGQYIGLPASEGDGDVVDLSYFWTNSFLWFYIYFTVFLVVFYGFWAVLSPHRWQNWSILVSGFLIFVTYFGVQVSVVINNWRGPYFNLIQKALSAPNSVSASELYLGLLTFLVIALVAVAAFVLTSFVTNHYVFRWRTAMNDFYMDNWTRLRSIEGAAQRVQEDTMRFSTIVESLGISLVSSVMTLVAFLPLLSSLSRHIVALPVVGVIPQPLVVAAILWAVFGTVLLSVIGIKLPGLQFLNQKVEAAYRKELVYGEDHVDRAGPITVQELFANVRKNYFRIYLHYTYFNTARSLYLQADNVFGIFLMIPSFAAGALTLGLYQQIAGAFNSVANSFQFLVNSWTTIVELLSIHKRLRAFEASLDTSGRMTHSEPTAVA